LLGYQEMSVTDGCLVMIIILLSIIIVTGISHHQQQQRFSQRQPSAPGSETDPYPQQSPSRGVRRPLPHSSSRRPNPRE